MQFKNTIQIQVQSVIGFMSALGYTPDPRVKGLSFVNAMNPNSAAVRIRFSTAVALHNSKLDDFKVIEGHELCFNENVKLNVAFSNVAVLLADAGKLVEQCKVSISRAGVVIVNHENTHLIKTKNARIAELIAQEAE